MVQRLAAWCVLHHYQLKACITGMFTAHEMGTLEQRRLTTKVVMSSHIVHKLVKIPSDQLLVQFSVLLDISKQKFRKLPFSHPSYHCGTPSHKVVAATSFGNFETQLAYIHLEPPKYKQADLVKFQPVLPSISVTFISPSTHVLWTILTF